MTSEELIEDRKFLQDQIGQLTIRIRRNGYTLKAFQTAGGERMKTEMEKAAVMVADDIAMRESLEADLAALENHAGDR